MTQEKGKHVDIATKNDQKELSKTGWHPLLKLREEIDHAIEEFQHGWPFSSIGRKSKLHPLDAAFTFGIQTPALDIVDRKKAIEIKADLPGMDENDINVEVSQNMLTISGEKNEEREEGEKEGNYYLSERRYGAFKRSLSIPDGIDANKVDASFDKGVLKITLPKTPESQAKTRKIKVKAKA